VSSETKSIPRIRPGLPEKEGGKGHPTLLPMKGEERKKKAGPIDERITTSCRRISEEKEEVRKNSNGGKRKRGKRRGRQSSIAPCRYRKRKGETHLNYSRQRRGGRGGTANICQTVPTDFSSRKERVKKSSPIYLRGGPSTISLKKEGGKRG